MSMDVSRVTVGTSLSISVSGTERLQRAVAAEVQPNALPTTPFERAAGSGKLSAAEALAEAGGATRDAIERALQKFDPAASLAAFEDGKHFHGHGLLIDLIA